MAGQTFAYNAPGHAANGLIAHLFAIHNATHGTLDEQVLLQTLQGERERHM